MSCRLVWLGYVLGLICGTGVSACAQEALADPAGPDCRFAALYNRRDFSGWEQSPGPADGWRAQGEALTCAATAGRWLKTSQSFSDFVLRLEYRIARGAVSAVGVRLPKQGDPRGEGLVVDIVDDTIEPQLRSPARPTGSLGEGAKAPEGRSHNPGEWNHFEITCRGPQVCIDLNSRRLLDVNTDQLDEAPGAMRALSDRATMGAIGLMGSAAAVDFRNITIRDLTSVTASGVTWVDIETGEGAEVAPDDTLLVHVTGRLTDGTRFETSRGRPDARPRAMVLAEVVPGFREGVKGMRAGGKRRISVPPEQAYGQEGVRGKIPPRATLVFDVEIVEAVPAGRSRTNR